MSNNVHGLTVKDDSGKTKAHPLYWVWHEKRKNYDMCDSWYDDVLEFHDWCLDHYWKKGNSIRRHDTDEPFSPENCYIHVRGTPLGEEK
jgi:hypothetical protein